MAQKEITTQCCIAGGGPAGIMLGFLLARAGVEVTVLEKWPDFFRDFRGDTIHPSTMDVLREIGLLDEFLKLKHSETREIDGYISGKRAIVADFSHLKTYCKFIAFIPQWDFLNFIAGHGKNYPSFHLMMETEATDLMEENGTVVGVRAKSREEIFDIRANLVIGADGRHSTVREKSGLTGRTFGSPIDVLWFRISRNASDPVASLGSGDKGKILILIDRDEYWQCGMVIKKDSFDTIKAKGLDAFQKEVAALAPFAAGHVQEIKSWDDVKLLSIAVDRLDTWYRPGLLCIGDSAHAMSPIGGIGINVAIQDAVAAANILIPKFRNGGAPAVADLAAVQARREPPTRKTQRLQVFLQDHIIEKIVESGERHYSLPWQIRMMQWFPFLRRIPARIVGVGFQPEHIEH